MTTPKSGKPLVCALDFASNWEIRGGVWRYGIELTQELVKLIGPESVSVPVYDHLPAERLSELLNTGAVIRNRGWFTCFDRLDAMTRRNGRFVPWKTILPWFYTPQRKQNLFRAGLGNADVCHAIFTCRGTPEQGVTVGTLHDIIPFLYSDEAGFSKERFQNMLNDHRRWAQLVIVPSQTTKRDLVEQMQFPADRVRVIYHGIDSKRFTPSAALSDDLLKRHQLKPGHYLLYVGALERRKNIERLIEAYHAGIGGRDDFPLVLSGAMIHDMPRLKSALEDGTGRVRHIGYVSDEELPGLYRGARALIHVAIAEGFGFTPLEAMSCGTPVVASRQTATGEMAGDAGVLVDALEVDAIARAISEIISNDTLHSRLSASGLARAADFTWKQCAEKTYAVYQEAYQQRGRP